MIITFNFNLEAWVRHIAIEADSEEAAKEKLMSMTLADMINEDAVVDTELQISDIDAVVTSYDAVVHVTDIEYDFDLDSMDASVAAYLANRLPKEQTITITGVRDDDDLEELIDSEIYSITGYVTKSFEFQTIEKK